MARARYRKFTATLGKWIQRVIIRSASDLQGHQSSMEFLTFSSSWRTCWCGVKSQEPQSVVDMFLVGRFCKWRSTPFQVPYPVSRVSSIWQCCLFQGLLDCLTVRGHLSQENSLVSHTGFCYLEYCICNKCIGSDARMRINVQDIDIELVT